MIDKSTGLSDFLSSAETVGQSNDLCNKTVYLLTWECYHIRYVTTSLGNIFYSYKLL